MPFYDSKLNELLPKNYHDYFDKSYLYPSFPLNEFIDNYIILNNKKVCDTSRWLILPDVNTYLIFVKNIDCRESCWEILFVGPRSKSLEIKHSGRCVTIITTFKLFGSHSFIKLPMNEFENKILDLKLLWKLQCSLLTEKLTSCNNEFEYIKALEGFLLYNLTGCSVNLSIKGTTSIIKKGGALKVKDLSKQAGFSERHLLELMKRNVGLSTKKMIRINRLMKCFFLIDKLNYTGSWTTVAYDAGYSDQSHLIDDFNEMLSCTPNAFLNRFRDT